MKRRNDACRYGAAKAKGISNRDDPIPDPCFRAVTKFDERQVLCFDLQNRQVGSYVPANQFCFIFLAIGKDDRDRIHGHTGIAGGYDVRIGDDIAIGRDDEARTKRLRLTRLGLTAGKSEKAAKGRTFKGISYLNALAG